MSKKSTSSSSSVDPAAEQCDSSSRNDPNAYASTFRVPRDRFNPATEIQEQTEVKIQAAYPYAIVCTRCKNHVAGEEDVFSLSDFGPSEGFANDGLIGVVRAIGVEMDHPDLPLPLMDSEKFRAKYVRCTECRDTVGKLIQSLESEVLWKAAVEIEVNN